jgi:hypothetical protein
MVSVLFIHDDALLTTPGTVRKLLDPACGTGGMLAEAQNWLRDHHPQARLYVYGQDYNIEGDILVCEGGESGHTAIWDGAVSECYFQKAIHRLRPAGSQDDPRFFRYFMRMAFDAGMFASATASTIKHLPAEKL